jgi:hypothetical protein
MIDTLQDANLEVVIEDSRQSKPKQSVLNTQNSKYERGSRTEDLAIDSLCLPDDIPKSTNFKHPMLNSADNKNELMALKHCDFLRTKQKTLQRNNSAMIRPDRDIENIRNLYRGMMNRLMMEEEWQKQATINRNKVKVITSTEIQKMLGK